MKIQTPEGKVLLRYTKQQIEQRLKIGRFFISNSMNNPEYIPEVAIVEASHNNKYLKGTEIIVSYRIGFDYNQNDPLDRTYKNEFFFEMDGEDELRWSADNEWNIFGIKVDGKITPTEGIVFCEVPKFREEKTNGGLWIPDTAKNVDTVRRGYKTKVKFIHPNDIERLGIDVGDEVWCAENSDIKKLIFGEEVITVYSKKILAKEDEEYDLSLKLIPYMATYEEE